ncbi:MAG: hypothetical protein ACLPWS_14425 [Rhodomicrobium sp.]
MFRLLAADAFFVAAVLIEVLAALSLLQSAQFAVLREEFEPVLAYYRAGAVPLLAPGAAIVWPDAPQWFTDASILSAVLFFLFFIAQARQAMAPHPSNGPGVPGPGGWAPDRTEAAIDWALPVALCVLGALLLAPTLLPLLSLPAALFLGVKKLAGHPSWFEVSRSYYVNTLCLTVAIAGILAFQR